MHLMITGYGALVLYVGMFLAFLLSVFWKPEIGLYYLVPLLPMQTVRYWLHVYPLGEKLVDVILLGILIGLFFHSKPPVFVSSPLNKVIIIFAILTYLSLWQGAFYLGRDMPISYLDPRFSDWKNYVEMLCVFFVVAATIRTPKQMGILIALMCLSIFVVNRSYHSTIGDRDFSHFSDDLRDEGPLGYAGENGMGAFQAQMAIFLIGLAGFVKKRWLKLGLWALIATCIYCLLFTFSRGAYLGFLVGLLALGLMKQKKYLLILGVILVSWQSIVPGAVKDRVLMTYQADGELDSSAEERVTIWQDAMDVIHEDPVFGTGFDTYKFLSRVGPYSDTHNYYVKIAFELGMVGLIIFLWMLKATSQMAWNLRFAKDPFLSTLGYAFFAMFMTALIVNFFGDRWSYLQVNGFLWVLLGFVARGLVLANQDQQVLATEPKEISIPLSAAAGGFHA